MGNLNCLADGDSSTSQTEDVGPKVCILMLGAGDGGKSTIFKQLQIIYRNAFHIWKDRVEYTPTIIENVINSMRVLAKASIQFNIPMSTPDNMERALRVNDFTDEMLFRTEERGWKCLPDGFTAADLYELWNDRGIQATCERRNEFHLDDNAPHYLNNLGRLVDSAYVPSVQDVLKSRTKSVGIIHETFNSGLEKFEVVDVGGQKSERKKWISLFDNENIHAVVYVSSLSEFDQLMWEDDKTPRLEDSLRVFTLFYKYFKSKDIYLVLNKEDVMREKIAQGRHMSNFFKDFVGDDSDPEAVKSYFYQRFKTCDQDNRIKDVYYTSAVDEASVKSQVQRIVDSIVRSRFSPPVSLAADTNGSSPKHASIDRNAAI